MGEEKTITITQEKHESLMEDRIRLAILKKYVKNTDYIDKDMIGNILDIPKEK